MQIQVTCKCGAVYMPGLHTHNCKTEDTMSATPRPFYYRRRESTTGNGVMFDVYNPETFLIAQAINEPQAVLIVTALNLHQNIAKGDAFYTEHHPVFIAGEDVAIHFKMQKKEIPTPLALSHNRVEVFEAAVEALKAVVERHEKLFPKSSFDSTLNTVYKQAKAALALCEQAGKETP